MDAPIDPDLGHDASALVRAAGGAIDAAVVLGSGLSEALRGRFAHESVAYRALRTIPIASLAGHSGEALAGTWAAKRIVAFAGRVHLYQGFSAGQVTAQVRLAKAAGARAVILTNAAGGLNPEYRAGDIMMLADHINLTGHNPLVGLPLKNPFTDMSRPYSPRLRDAVRASASSKALREGVYAGLLGPSYETAAEAHYLRTIGADAAGMSTVLEAILARTLGLEVCAMSLITNAVGAETSHAEVTAAGARCARAMADFIETAIRAI